MNKILLSACLAGEPVRYNGLALSVDSTILNEWLKARRIVPFCPEVSGGLPTPRSPAEISNGDGLSVITGTAKVLQQDGTDKSAAFLRGAQLALDLCLKHDIRIAILTESSPSCGSTMVYDGSFSSKKITGLGVTSALLMENGIRVFSQHSIDAAARFLGSLEK